MNGLTAAKVERLAAGTNLLTHQADEMHLDTALFLVVARAMAKARNIKLSTKLAVDAHEQIEVEGRGDPGFIVVGSGEHVRVFDQIDSDDEQCAGPEHRCGMPQQRIGLMRLEIPDGGTRK